MLDFTTIGSVNNYLKNIDMQQKWDQKQQTGNYMHDDVKTASEWVEKQQDTFKKTEQEKDSDQILDSIKNKAAYGGRLTSSELKYLQSKDKIAYQQAVDAENERIIYEHELRMCRTKEDVQMYKLSHTVQAAERVKSAMNSSSMSQDDKLSAVMGEYQKMSAVNAVERDFVRSGEYSKLPSQSEKLKAERDLKRAAKEESRAAAEKRAEKKAEQAERAEKAKQKRAEAKAKAEGKGKKNVKGLSQKKKRFKAKKAKYTMAQAQNTNEARKVRRANAKADYEMTQGYAARAIIAASSGRFDTKA